MRHMLTHTGENLCSYTQQTNAVERIFNDYFTVLIMELNHNTETNVVERTYNLGGVDKYIKTPTEIVAVKTENLKFTIEDTNSQQLACETEILADLGSCKTEQALNDPQMLTNIDRFDNYVLTFKSEEPFKSEECIQIGEKESLNDGMPDLVYYSSQYSNGDKRRIDQNSFDNCTATASYLPCSQTDLVRHYEIHTRVKPHKCTVCDYEGSSRSNLWHHVRRKHKALKPFTCGQCEYASSVKCNLLRHINRHTDEGTFSCGLCSYVTSTRNQFLVHMRSHNGKKQLKCELCGYLSPSSSHLEVHLRRKHTGQRPFHCGECSYATAAKSTLVRHMRTHAEKRPFTCGLCSFATIDKATLIPHMRTHTGEKPYKCNVCGHRVITKSQLVIHMRIHTGEKPYTCDTCGRCFNTRGILINHMGTHGGEKLFKCAECDRSFLRKAYLQIHLRTHTEHKLYTESPLTAEHTLKQMQERRSCDGVNHSEKTAATEDLSDCLLTCKVKELYMPIHTGEQLYEQNALDGLQLGPVATHTSRELHTSKQLDEEVKKTSMGDHCGNSVADLQKLNVSQTSSREIDNATLTPKIEQEHVTCTATQIVKQIQESEMFGEVINHDEETTASEDFGYRLLTCKVEQLYMPMHIALQPCEENNVQGLRSDLMETHAEDHISKQLDEEANKTSMGDYRANSLPHLEKCRDYHQYKCKTSNKSKISVHMGTYTVKDCFKCSFCEHTAPSKAQLDQHMQKHSSKYCGVKAHVTQKLFKCEFCDYSSVEKTNVNRHMLRHNGERPYKCTVCSYATRSKTCLLNHMRTHTGEKMFKCSLCSYAASVKKCLVEHMRKHTGQYLYKCDLCDYETSLVSNFKNHMRARHTDDKPFSCNVCDYASAQKAKLVRHLKKHTGELPFQCGLCTFATLDKATLIPHMRRHSGEKPYGCSVCDYRCITKSQLVAHTRKHSGEKPYACDICDRRVPTKTNLRKHIQTHAFESKSMLHAGNKTITSQKTCFEMIKVECLTV